MGGFSSSRIGRVIAVAISVAIMAWLLSRIGLASVKEILGGADVRMLGLLLAVGLLEALADGVAFSIAFGRRVRTGYCIAANSAGAVVNLLLPFEAGEVVKGVIFGRRSGGKDAVSATVLWNYLFKLSRPIVTLLAGGVGLLASSAASASLIGWVLLSCVLCFLPFALLRMVLRRGASEWVVRMLGKLPRVRPRAERWLSTAKAVDHEVTHAFRERPGDWLRILLWQMLGRLFGWSTVFVTFHALGVPATFAQASLVFALLTAMEYIAALAPARVGVGEGGGFLIFQWLSLSPSTGAIVFAMIRVRGLVANGLLALPALFTFRKP